MYSSFHSLRRRKKFVLFSALLSSGLCGLYPAPAAYADDTPSPPKPLAVEPTISQSSSDLGPDPEVLVRPKNSPLPASGVPISPWPGLATMVVPSTDNYSSRNNFHKMELDDLSGKEGVSWLLPSEVDAQRRTDMDDPYYVPTAGSGHLFQPIMPFRERLQKKGLCFRSPTKGKRWPTFMAACSVAWITCMN